MYIELKAFQSEHSSPVQTKIQLNVGTPFSANVNPEILKEKFDPKKVYDLLQFIANDLIPRLVIKANEDHDTFKTQLEKLVAIRGKDTKWEDFFKDSSDKSEFIQLERAMLDDAIKDMAKLKKPEIQQFNFDELSPGILANSIMSIVNSNVPPPRG
jgi:hypothetical protein